MIAPSDWSGLRGEAYKLASNRQDGWACERISEGDLTHSDVAPYVAYIERGYRGPLPPVHPRSREAWYGWERTDEC